MSIRHRVLGHPRGYAAFRRLLRAESATRTIITDHIRCKPGDRVLDLGCGNGELANYLPGVEYVGVDHNPKYIASARGPRTSAAHVEFLEADLADLGSLTLENFDVVVALGVLHHLSTPVASATVANAYDLLNDEGRLVTLDPTFHPEQRSITRILMAMDRGLYVRHPEDYERLIRASFPDLRTTIRSDLVPFPYTHCIIEASKPKRDIPAITS
ncbi:MAG: class I SAM-dependent methyltransferase [Ilumatobacteraceae bacterium]